LGHGLEQGELPSRRATVPDDAQAAGVAQEPADPDGVALRPPGRMDSWVLHLADDLRDAVAEVESPPRDEITRRRGEPADRIPRAREAHRHYRRAAVLQALMVDGVPRA
jgi:hypothetical protein